MLKIEDYITKRKKVDKLNEFDFEKNSDNMQAIIQYVMDYFNNYLNIDEYSQEQMKTQQIVEKFKKGIELRYPGCEDMVVDYYWKHKKRIDKFVENAYGEFEDGGLFYSKEDYQKIVQYVCDHQLIEPPDEEVKKGLMKLTEAVCSQYHDKPQYSDMVELDNAIVSWVRNTYRDYKVNLREYAAEIAWEYDKNYIKSTYNAYNRVHYYYNQYDYRYQENPFEIEEIYERNKHRPFIEGRRGELEMLIMYAWLKDMVEDMDYWPEYVTLCIQNKRVNLARAKRKLVPVAIKGIGYPECFTPQISYIETSDGSLRDPVKGAYILHIVNDKTNRDLWTSDKMIETLIKNLQKSFKENKAPKLLEFRSPYKGGVTEEAFFRRYRMLENGLANYKSLQFALVNGQVKNLGGASYLFAETADLERLHKTSRELGLKLKLSVDYTDKNNRNQLKKDSSNALEFLAEVRSYVVAIHINEIVDWKRSPEKEYGKRDDAPDRIHYGTQDKYLISKFVSGLGMILQDSKERYLIPDTVKSSDGLEELIDVLMRAGCYFDLEDKGYDER